MKPNGGKGGHYTVTPPEPVGDYLRKLYTPEQLQQWVEELSADVGPPSPEAVARFLGMLPKAKP